MEYLVFLKVSLGLIGAITASLYFWTKNKSKGLKKPIETEDGYLVENQANLETEVNFDSKLLIKPIETSSLVNEIIETQVNLENNIISENLNEQVVVVVEDSNNESLNENTIINNQE